MEVRCSRGWRGCACVLLFLFFSSNRVYGEEATNTVFFGEPGRTVNEGAGTIHVPVYRETVQTEPTSVNFRIQSEDLDAGVDYIVTNHTVVIEWGNSAAIPIELIDNEEREADRTLTIELIEPDPKVALSNSVFQLKVLEDDLPYGVDSAFKPLASSGAVNDILITAEGEIAVASKGAGMRVVRSDGSLRYDHPLGLATMTGRSLALMNDGAILYGGDFVLPSGGSEPILLQGINRISGNQSDPHFWSPIDGKAHQILPLAGGHFAVAGTFRLTGPNANQYHGLARFDEIGAVDVSFLTNAGVNLEVTVAATDSEGGIIGAGTETNENGIVRSFIRRWDSNGMVDANFELGVQTSIGGEFKVTALAALPGGEPLFIAAVRKESAESGEQTELLLISAEGAVSGEFGAGIIHGTVRAIALEVNESAVENRFDVIYIGGLFDRVGTRECNSLAAFAPSGELLWCAEGEHGPNGSISSLEVQPDGAILVGGEFWRFSGVERRLVRLKGRAAEGTNYVYWSRAESRTYENDGVAELVAYRAGDKSAPLEVEVIGPGANPDLGPLPNLHFGAGEDRAAIMILIIDDLEAEGRESVQLQFGELPAGTVSGRNSVRLEIRDDETAGGLLRGFNPFSTNRVTQVSQQPDGKILAIVQERFKTYSSRLNADGSVDDEFRTNSISIAGGESELKFAFAPEGRIYVAGNFTVPGTSIAQLARLNSDGSVDRSFNAGASASLEMSWVIATQPDGRLIVGSDRAYSGLGSSFPLRLNIDGTIDHAFRTRVEGLERAIAVQSDGKILISEFSPQTRRHIWRRLNSDGSADRSLAAPFSRTVFSLLVEDQTALLYAADAEEDLAAAAPRLLRINLSDGSLDETFSADVNHIVTEIHQLADGKLLISGPFTRVNGRERYRVARLHANGELDESFDAGFGPDIAPSSAAVLKDGSILVAGKHSMIDRSESLGFARLGNGVTVPPEPPTVQIKMNGATALIRYPAGATLQRSTDLATWRDVAGSGAATGEERQEFIEEALQERSFYRSRR